MRTSAVLATTAAIILTNCASEETPVTTDDYLEELQAICAQTGADVDALPAPPDEISVSDFATEAADLLENEAEAVRALEAPAELEGDQRAFVRNTDDQVAAWRTIAEDPDALVEISTHILELSGGRDDLVTSMGAPACRQGQE